MSDKKIAYIVSRYPTLTETFIIREVEEIRRKGIEIEVFSLKTAKPQDVVKAGLNELLENTNYSAASFSFLTFQSLLLFSFTRPATLSKFIYKIIKTHYKKPVLLYKTLRDIPKALTITSILRRKNIKKIHAHWATRPTTVALLISELNNLDYTFTAHAWDIYKEDVMLDYKITKAKTVITCTNYNKKYLLEKYPDIEPDKIKRIYHGLDLKRFRLIERNRDSTFTLLSIGRLVHKKGFDILLRSCAELIEKEIPFICQIVYVEGKSRDEIFRLYKELGLRDHVHFIPAMPQDKLIEYYYNSDCFVLPSIISESGDRDGIPNVFLEALATGLPVISTEISGIPEVVINNKTGLLVKPNDVEGLVTEIEKLYLDKNLRTELGRRGRELVQEKFDNSTNVDRLLSSIL